MQLFYVYYSKRAQKRRRPSKAGVSWRKEEGDGMENSGSIVVVRRGADDQSEKEHRAADFESGVVAALLLVILPRRFGAVLVFRLRRGNGPVRVRRRRIAVRRGSRRRFVRRNGGAAGLMRRGGRIVMRLRFAGMMRLLRSRFCGRRSRLCRLMVLLRCRLCRRGLLWWIGPGRGGLGSRLLRLGLGGGFRRRVFWRLRGGQNGQRRRENERTHQQGSHHYTCQFHGRQSFL